MCKFQSAFHTAGLPEVAQQQQQELEQLLDEVFFLPPGRVCAGYVQIWPNPGEERGAGGGDRRVVWNVTGWSWGRV